MKLIFASIILPALSFSLMTGCGLSKAVEATSSVPDKIDSTNGEVKKTNQGMQDMKDEVKKTNDQLQTMVDQVKKTNDQMGTMVDQVRRTNDGIDRTNDQVSETNSGLHKMADALNQSNAGIDRSNEGIAKTNAAVHNQTMAVALAEMLKPDNTQFLTPPTGMLPAGQVFATEGTPDEIAKIIQVFITEIETATPDRSEMDDQGKWKPETIKRVDHEKKVKFNAAAIISGLAPQSTIDQLLQAQIDQGGQYENITYAILMFRYMFIHDLELEGDLLAQPITNPGLLNAAVNLALNLSKISDLPYHDQIHVKTTGMLDPDDNYDLTLNTQQMKVIWQKLNHAYNKELLPKYKDPSSSETRTVAHLHEVIAAHVQP